MYCHHCPVYSMYNTRVISEYAVGPTIYIFSFYKFDVYCTLYVKPFFKKKQMYNVQYMDTLYCKAVAFCSQTL